MPTPHLAGKRRQLLVAAVYFVNVIGVVAQLYASPLYWKQEYHTSKLTGQAWVDELIHGHHDRIWTELGMRVNIFLTFVHELHSVCGLKDAKIVTLNEQATIFLYMCITGLSIRHIGEQFQRSNETVSK